jgi:hypothetical protein
LPADQNQWLSAWQLAHLWLTWHVQAAPWNVEDRIIEKMLPPLNSKANHAHPFFAALNAARAAFRQMAYT